MDDLLRQIAARRGWAMTAELAALQVISVSAVQKNIDRRKYEQRNIRQIAGANSGQGGRLWQIHITDPAIPAHIRKAYSRFCIEISFGNETPDLPVDSGVRAAVSSLPEVGVSSFTPPPASFSCESDTVRAHRQLSDEEIEAEYFAAASKSAQRKAQKYLAILKACEGLHGHDELNRFAAEWNRQHPDWKTSRSAIRSARKEYAEQGVIGLLARYGNRAGESAVPDKWLEVFQSFYMKEGGPSVYSSWLLTLGHAKRFDQQIAVAEFPSARAFLRRLERETPADSIYLARHGEQAWNRKFGNFIDRDYSELLPGECIVGDHAQVDVAVRLKTGKVCFPWITAWRCFKSGKWLGWMHHPEAPNSDHVFQSFYYAVRKFGAPQDVYIDNGKDYRCRDFAGGRKTMKVNIDEGRATAMLALLKITARFALPYNPQAKTIERDFLRNKELFSKHMPGYRGGDVTERPERLKGEIKNDLILPWDEYVAHLDTFIEQVLNKIPVHGKIHKGMSPDELWRAELIQQRHIGRDALKLFCMRTSSDYTIGRNGIKDSALGVYYWAEWMVGVKGKKVYMRRDIQAYQEAWCFSAENDEYLGRAVIAERAAALARTDVQKAQLRDLMAQKNQARKIAKAYASAQAAPSPSEIIANYQAGIAALQEDTFYELPERTETTVTQLANTIMDDVVNQDREMERSGTVDLSMFVPEKLPKKRIYLFEHERDEAERAIGAR